MDIDAMSYKTERESLCNAEKYLQFRIVFKPQKIAASAYTITKIDAKC